MDMGTFWLIVAIVEILAFWYTHNEAKKHPVEKKEPDEIDDLIDDLWWKLNPGPRTFEEVHAKQMRKLKRKYHIK